MVGRKDFIFKGISEGPRCRLLFVQRRVHIKIRDLLIKKYKLCFFKRKLIGYLPECKEIGNPSSLCASSSYYYPEGKLI